MSPRPLLHLLALVGTSFVAGSPAVFAQAQPAEYVSVQAHVQALAVGDNDELYVYRGGPLTDDGDGLYPLARVDQTANPQQLIELNSQDVRAHNAVFYDRADATYYELYVEYADCDVFNSTFFISAVPEQLLGQGQGTQTLFQPQSANGFFLNELSVSDGRFVAAGTRVLVAGSLTDPSTLVELTMQDANWVDFPNRVGVLSQGNFVVAGANTLYAVRANGSIDSVAVSAEVLGVGSLSSPGAAPTPYIITRDGGYSLDSNLRLTQLEQYAATYTISSLAVEPYGTGFLCVYEDGGAGPFYGYRSNNPAAIEIAGASSVEQSNPAKFSLYQSRDASAGPTLHHYCVLAFDNHLTNLVINAETRAQLASISYADVSFDVLEVIYSPAGGSAASTFTPTVTNSTADTISRLHFSGEAYSSICRQQLQFEYNDLDLVPGETRKLPSQPISHPFLTDSLTYQLNTADNLPILPGNQRELVGAATVVSSKEVLAKAIQLAPNPANDYIRILGLEAGERISSIYFRDFLGRIHTAILNGDRVDVADLRAGQYVLYARLESGEVAAQRCMIMR